jgi:hypothetical protein
MIADLELIRKPCRTEGSVGMKEGDVDNNKLVEDGLCCVLC